MVRAGGKVIFCLYAFALLTGTCSVGYGQVISVTAHPNQWTVNEVGILRFQIEVDEGRLTQGDRVSLFVPGSWVSHLFPVCKGRKQQYQLVDYLSVHTGGPASVSLHVRPRGRDGTYHRLAREVVMQVDSGAVEAGETISLVYGSEERPIHASFLAQESLFELRYGDSKTEGRKRRSAARVVTLPATIKRVQVTIPTLAKVGETIQVHVTGRDGFGNPAPLPSQMTYHSETGSVAGVLDTQDKAFHTFGILFSEPGFHRVHLASEAVGRAVSNPVKVTTKAPERKIYWGDLHSHSHMSKDGVGWEPFVFARNYANLDFYAQTEHTSNDRSGVSGITDQEWLHIQEEVKRFNDPGRFVTILGYETSFPDRHHNVYFDTDTAPLYRKHEVGDVRELWRRLEAKHAFTVPHHTGITWGSGSEWIREHPAGLRPLIEIYSGHGLSELYDPDHPLSYSQALFTKRWQDWLHAQAPDTPDDCRGSEAGQTKEGPYYARDAWALGLRFGAVASSDDHSARPGQSEKGLTAVRAERLDRSHLFRALRRKQTYATTGQRIYLDVRLNRPPADQVGGVDANPRIEIEAHGTDSLAWVELLRYDPARNHYAARRWYPDGLYFKGDVPVMDAASSAFYYVRLRQKSPVKDRPVMAWSSPVWVGGSSTDSN